MSKGSISSHYVPRLILRKFSDKLCLYNVKTGELQENIVPEHAYMIDDLYDRETEKKLNEKIESQFGNLLSNVILKADKEISLTRPQLLLIKKFLLISVLRTIQNELFLQKEKQFHMILHFPFEEKQIDGETPFDYWMRTLNAVLDTDGTPKEILEHPDKTYPAYRWSQVVNGAYIAFWDSIEGRDEFVITDIGMTSENEKGWDGIRTHNDKKLNWLKQLLDDSTNEIEKSNIARVIHSTCDFSENFMMFPISSKRMIVLICPFYKYRYVCKNAGVKVPDLECLTVIPNESLFEPNGNKYILPQMPGKPYNYHEDDRYIYNIKQLTSSEIRYCNALFMDRIDTYLGFSSLEHAVGSIIKYKKLNDPPFIPRVDYTELYKIIQKRYLGSLNV